MNRQESLSESMIMGEYFRQHNAILDGRDRLKCISEFRKFSSLHCVEGDTLTQDFIEDLVNKLGVIETEDKSKDSFHKLKFSSFPIRQYIYCLLGSFVCVLLLHYSRH